MQHANVGVREAKAHLSRLLRMVQNGYEFTLSHRGRPVARLVPVASGSLSPLEQVRRLEDAGLLERHEPGQRRPVARPIPVAGKGAQKLLQENREDGAR